MIYIWQSRCKWFSPQTWSKFVRFDLKKNLYTLHYEIGEVLVHLISTMRKIPETTETTEFCFDTQPKKFT